ncbi:hypothetical protein [Pseudobacillus wudalianchiensis]|uniref:Secreted protein n=1 Tax=Pseudobacillus wudalianchiensis TaxID=1743143 RepID=A0A1B9B840_9BACI|nr:hypothetical protein [Bacillus wudalianchiensis]OCA92232.1 hypothetical protein A8F95_00445 [Bacillus wudalianchiensis]
MKKWAIAAILYLISVVGVYTIYDHVTSKGKSVSSEVNHQQNEHEAAKEAAHDHHEKVPPVKSDVKASIEYENKHVTIMLQDQKGNPVDDLEVNHEKLLHLIVVDEGLEQYWHLHPQRIGAGKFQVEQELKKGTYKAFVDIKPKKLSYHVSPLEMVIGAPSSHGHAPTIIPDKDLTKTVGNETVKMNMSAHTAGTPVTLTFDLDEEKIEPYLGAMGHVVILDEQAENYLHVHPLEGEAPVFETQFKQPGIYKVWAEFKQDGKVRVYPYVIEIN